MPRAFLMQYTRQESVDMACVDDLHKLKVKVKPEDSEEESEVDVTDIDSDDDDLLGCDVTPRGPDHHASPDAPSGRPAAPSPGTDNTHYDPSANQHSAFRRVRGSRDTSHWQQQQHTQQPLPAHLYPTLHLRASLELHATPSLFPFHPSHPSHPAPAAPQSSRDLVPSFQLTPAVLPDYRPPGHVPRPFPPPFSSDVSSLGLLDPRLSFTNSWMNSFRPSPEKSDFFKHHFPGGLASTPVTSRATSSTITHSKHDQNDSGAGSEEDDVTVKAEGGVTTVSPQSPKKRLPGERQNDSGLQSSPGSEGSAGHHGSPPDVGDPRVRRDVSASVTSPHVVFRPMTSSAFTSGGSRYAGLRLSPHVSQEIPLPSSLPLHMPRLPHPPLPGAPLFSSPPLGLLPGLPGLMGRPRDPNRQPAVKKYKCDVCGKAFSRSNTLVTHKRIHTGEKPFKCEICSRAFRQPGNLTRHRLTHTTLKPYVCPKCNKSFNRASNLHTHMRTHANFRPYVCPYCGKGFQQKVDMKIHCYTHTGRPDIAAQVDL